MYLLINGQNLFELQNFLEADERCADIHIKAGFLRKIQVLEMRTRPLSAMEGASGYLLTAIKVSSLAED